MYTHTVKEPYWFISPLDAAIDTEITTGECDEECDGDEHSDKCEKRPQFDHKLYMQTGDKKYLPLKNGTKPQRWRLKHLGAKEHAYVMGLFAQAAQDQGITTVEIGLRIVELALISCEGVQYMVDGTVKDLEIRHCRGHDGLTRVDPTVMDLIYAMNRTLVIAIGDWVTTEDIVGNPT